MSVLQKQLNLIGKLTSEEKLVFLRNWWLVSLVTNDKYMTPDERVVTHVALARDISIGVQNAEVTYESIIESVWHSSDAILEILTAIDTGARWLNTKPPQYEITRRCFILEETLADFNAAVDNRMYHNNTFLPELWNEAFYAVTVVRQLESVLLARERLLNALDSLPFYTRWLNRHKLNELKQQMHFQ